MGDADTICALSTALGEGGIGIVRVSGPAAPALLKKVFVPVRKQTELAHRYLTLGHVVDPRSGRCVDEVFAVLLGQPRTYTREDMAEIHCHGGVTAQEAILSLLVREGARLAEPGEFTKRAFLNGRIDLLQAESVLDIIRSETEAELGYAVDHLAGRLSEALGRIKGRLTGIVADVEALLDFPEEEIDVDTERIGPELKTLGAELSSLIGSYARGRAFREGLEVLIVGGTNVGKSSLLNALLLQERAIVTPVPGTTRDLIEGTMHIGGAKIKVVDTAGLRQPRDVVEEEGIERVKKRIPGADLILWVIDASRPYSAEDGMVRRRIEERPFLTVINKIDLPPAMETGVADLEGLSPVRVSATAGDGIEGLKREIHGRLMGKAKRPAMLVTHARHRDALVRAREGLSRARRCLGKGEPMEFVAAELREALRCFGEITGETCPEEILGTIFARFCVGK